MKTLIKKLKFGVLLLGFATLSSCGNDATVVSAAGINVIHYTIPTLVITATKYARNKVSKYLKSSTTVKNGNGITGRKVEKAGCNYRVMPISIGIAGDVRLVSSTNR